MYDRWVIDAPPAVMPIDLTLFQLEIDSGGTMLPAAVP